MSDERTRGFEMQIEIDAPPEAVWQALTDARELTRWFPLDANVTPGVGGSVRYAWGGAWEWSTRIRIWEPLRRLGLVNSEAVPYDAEGRPLERRGPAIEVALDYHLQGRGGRTVLRLVHSGFGAGAEWDDEVDGISHGWPAELLSLRHYLERHRGRPRVVAWARVVTATDLEGAWQQVAGPRGLSLSGRSGALRPGDRYAARLDGADLTGTTQLFTPPFTFAGTLESAGDGLLRAWVDSMAGERSVNVWVSAWGGGHESAVHDLERRAAARLQELFGVSAVAAGALSA